MVTASRLTSSENGPARPLFICGTVVLATFANLLIFSSFPIQLLLPEWQLRMASALLGNGITALLGVVLVVIAQQGLSSRTSGLYGKARLIRQLAGWVAVGYLLLIPVQIAAGYRILNRTSAAEKERILQWGKLRRQIQLTESEAQLREVLSRLPEPPALPEKFELPFPRFKQDLISGNDARFAALETQGEKAGSERLQNFLAETLRNTIQSLLLSAGFSATSRQGSLPGLGRMQIPFMP